jgi:hypothetical protein
MIVPAHKKGAKGIRGDRPMGAFTAIISAAMIPMRVAIKKEVRTTGSPQRSPITAASLTSPSPSPFEISRTNRNKPAPDADAISEPNTDEGTKSICNTRIIKKQGRLRISGILWVLISITEMGMAKMKKTHAMGVFNPEGILGIVIADRPI